MDTFNIFESIGKATHRPEPFHSQFLADALRASLNGDRSLFDAFWRLSTPDGWEPPNTAVVISEHAFDDRRRIDMCIVDTAGPKGRVLGVEVKTSSASASAGQLEAYHKGLTKLHKSSDIAIAYLTPFNRQRAGKVASILPTVKIFDNFSKACKNARHVSWLDVADIPWDCNDTWKQHQTYVREKISSSEKLKPATLSNKEFADFFGAEAAGCFWEELSLIRVYPSDIGAELNLGNLAEIEVDPVTMVRAFEILIRDGDGVRARMKSDKFPDAEYQRFIESDCGAFHKALFDLSRRFENVWVEGKRNYALRIAHDQNSKGISLVTSKGTVILETGRPRRAT